MKDKAFSVTYMLDNVIRSTCAGELNYIAMGVCDSSYPTHLLPGWEATSVAFHTDEGSLFRSSDDAVPLNIPCSKNDIIKVSLSTCIKDSSKVSVEFYRNGASISQISTELPPGGFYGVVGLMSKGEKIAISQPVVTKRIDFEQLWEVCTPHTIAHEGCGLCSYSGPGDFQENSIGTIRTKSPIDPLGLEAKRCFEIRIIHPGEARYIAIGVVGKSYPFNMLPGWEESSVGYHADNGNLFHNRGEEEPTNHPCKEGDMMKCTVDPVQGSSKSVRVTFHRNQVHVGHVISWTPAGGFHLCVGMMSRKEKVQILLPELVSPYLPQSRKLQSEDIWEELNPNLVHERGGVYKYIGEGGVENVGSIRSKKQLNPESANWFEVKILNRGQHCYIALGVCSKLYSPTMLLGWDDLSIGFHADNGLILQRNFGEQSTSHPCNTGDVIRCTIEPVDGSEKQVKVCFHRNGVLAGTAIFWQPTGGYYAQIGCMSVGEVIEVQSPLVAVASLKPGLENVSRFLPPVEKTLQGEYVTSPMTAAVAALNSGTTANQLQGEGEAMRKKHSNSPQQPRTMPEQASHHINQSDTGPVSYDNQMTSDGMHPLHDPYFYYHHHRAPPGHYHPRHPPAPQGYYTQYYGDPPGYLPRHRYPLHYGHPGFTGYPGLRHPGGAGIPRQFPTSLPIYGDPNASFPPAAPSPDQMRLQPQLSEPSLATNPQQKQGLSDKEELRRQESSGSHSYAAQISTASSASDSTAQTDPVGDMVSPAQAANKLETIGEKGGAGYVGGKVSWSPLVQRYQYPSSHNATSPFNESPHSLVDKSSLKSYQTVLKPSEVQTAHTRDPREVSQPSSVPAQEIEIASKNGVTSHTDAPDGPCLPDQAQTTQSHEKMAEQVSEIATLTTQPKLELRGGTTAIAEQVTITPNDSVSDKVVARPPLIPQISVTSAPGPRVISKEENKTFKILHNVNFDEDGTYQSSLPEHETLENAYIVYRMPLSEKIPYFEVEVQHIGSDGNVAVGLVWDNYPVLYLPGILQGSIAFHSSTGSVHVGGSDDNHDQSAMPTPCIVGDVIGCRALLQYKSEVGTNEEKSVQVEFYLNGCLLTTASVFLPPSGFLPAVGFKGYRSKIKVSQNIQLNPETYFETHPLPRNFRNFVSPPPLPTGWLCLKNSQITEDDKLSMMQQQRGTPCVVQNCAPLSRTSTYFEVELQCPINSYSVLSIGAMPKAKTELKKYIPGEVNDSVGFLPLLGFIMKNSSISCTVPEVVSSQLYLKNTTIGVGIDFRSPPTSIESSSKSGTSVDTPSKSSRVTMFFTINGQQVSCILTNLPEGGLFPTFAIDSDSIKTTDCLATVHFPKQWPLFCGLPIGFARGVEHDLKLYDSSTFVDKKKSTDKDLSNSPVKQCTFVEKKKNDDKKDKDVDLSNSTVRAIQAAVPLSRTHSYFQIQIISGGESFRISCGLASYNYALNVHPGWQKDSIALHVDDGNLFLNGSHQMVTAASSYRGTVIGCGARFPEDGSSRFAEVFFTVNKKVVVKRFVKVPQLGFFPTIGVRTNGAIVNIDLDVPDPFPDMKFNTNCDHINNMEITGSNFQLASRSEPGGVLLASPLTTNNVLYFKVRPLTKKDGRIMVGFLTSKSSPLNLLLSDEDLKAYVIDISLGVVMIYDRYFQSKETCAVQNGVEFGCGFAPQSSLKKSLLFFTADNQVISYTLVDYMGEVYPCLLMIDSSTRLSMDMCAQWPNVTPIGPGWARYANVKFENSQITHSATQVKRKFPVGFLQTSSPISPIAPYFEIELISRAVDKAIAIGLASKRYPTNSWVGWNSESIAYHLDDGKLFKVSNLGHTFGPKAFTGDTVGCGVRFGTTSLSAAVKGGDKMEVFFTINGAVIGTQKVSFASGGMFPTICIESPSESVIFHQHSYFPPTSSIVSMKQWNSAYCVVQSGLMINYSCRHRESSGGTPKGFCQAKIPFSPGRNYFEVELTGCSENSQLQVGLSTLIPPGSISPNTYGILYSAGGQLITRKIAGTKGGVQKYTTDAQRASLGDRLGCSVKFEEDKPTTVEFFLNRMKVTEVDISALWRQQRIYPTIVFTHPGDSILPLLGLPKPTWNGSTLVGWLRSERVKLRNNIIEYSGPGKTSNDVGVAQISQALQLGKNSYLEIEILDPGARCTIGVGLAPADYRLDMLPGWGKESIGCHGDDGQLFQVSGSGVPFGPMWKKNDIIGLGIRSQSDAEPPGTEVQVYFTRNGEEIGHTTHGVPPSRLFPVIGLHSPGEKVKVHVRDSSVVPCNIDPRRSSWRSLCGVNVSSGSDSNTQVLTFKKNGRKPKQKIGVHISLAVSAQPFSNSMQYFEVDLLDIGTTGIAVGAVPYGYPLDQVTGWSEGSVGYHTDDGCLYASSLKGSVFGPVPHKGEVYSLALL